MNKRLTPLLLLVAGSIAASCSSTDSGEQGLVVESTAAITVPGQLPVPVEWDGTTVDLMFADALSSCSWQNDILTVMQSTRKDNYASAVTAHMYNSMCPSAPALGALTERWLRQRAIEGCNVAPTAGASASITLPKHHVPQMVPPNAAYLQGVQDTGVVAAADAILQAPTINLCIAQVLRAQSPGSAGGESLLFSSADQRLLLEITRERAQLAMLGFAQLAVAFTEQDPGILGTTLSGDAPLPIVIKWGRDVANQSLLKGMGEDFAAAVQLHAILTQEVAELFGRSSSAVDPRGGSAKTRAEEIWGAGSWRQRTLALLYGGDPLATDINDKSIPWTNPAGGQQPNVIVGGVSPLGWPSSTEQPFFQVDLSRPQVARLVALARQVDALDLKMVSSPVSASCSVVERPTTASRLYLAVEAGLRNASCFQQSGGVCATFTANSPPGAGVLSVDLSLGYSGFLLWKEHGISPEHAAIATSYLSELLEPMCTAPNTFNFVSGSRDLSAGTIGTTPAGAGLGAGWTRVSADASFVERGSMKIQPAFDRYTSFVMAPKMLPFASAPSQGFSMHPYSAVVTSVDESRRLLGGAAALVATREALLVADARLAAVSSPLPSHIKTSYFQHKEQVFAVVAGAAGPVGVTFRPVLTSTASISNSGGSASVLQSGGNYKWSVDVTVPANDSWWIPTATYDLVTVYNDPIADSLVSFPQTSIFGRTAQTVLQSASSTPMSIAWTTTALGTNLRSFHGELNSPIIMPPPQIPRVTLIARRSAAGVAGYQYAILAANVPFRAYSSAQGFYFSPLGSLGLYGDRLLRTLPGNPSKPAYDGFGFPANWVPPTDPTLFGGNATDAAGHYLARAHQAAGDATQAVQQAFDALLQQQTDAVVAEVALKKGSSLLKESVAALCGAGNVNCDTSMQIKAVFDDPSPFPSFPFPFCPLDATDEDTLDCVASHSLKIVASKFAIATPVWAARNDPTVPPFSAYSGGSLKGLFVAQWSDMQRLRNAARDVNSALESAKKHAHAFKTSMDGLSGQVEKECSYFRMAQAYLAGSLYAGGSLEAMTAYGMSELAAVPTDLLGIMSAREDQYIAQRQKCDDATAALPADEAQNIAALWDNVQTLASFATRVNDAAQTLAQSGAEIQFRLEEGKRAKAHADLEAALLQQSQTTSLGLYRQYHSYDLWRAKAVLEDARRYAVAARRAIEAKFLVDLSTMNAPEPFVAAPSSWADQIYDYDLSLPAAVGLSVGQEQAGGIYPNKILDYVGNLQRFVEGYAVSRPSASAHEDSDVITLLGPQTEIVDPQADGFGLDSISQQGAWSFFCPLNLSDKWVGLPTTLPDLGKADMACNGQKPTRARIAFSIDAWGRLNENAADAPPSNRYNARWDRLAVNIVGTGVKDCAQAGDPLSCYSSAFVRYDLSHTGPSWITDYEGTWRTLAVPVGRIDQAKALTAEQWLDPVTKGWSEPYVQAVARQELVERPLGGTYVLDFEVAPEVRLSHIERIQILMSSSYWVKQQ